MVRQQVIKVAVLFAGLLLVSISTTSMAKHNNGAQPVVLKDINPDPKVVEVNLEAVVTQVEYIPGVMTEVWSYNGVVPGPTINVKVGQTLVVNFTNKLPEPTTVHWHGLEVPANMDGSNISQGEVPPGGSFRYEYKVLTAATYWYHPHSNGNEQVEKGLYGAFIVSDRDDRRVRIPKSREYILMVDDVLLDDAGQVAGFASDFSNGLAPDERAEHLLNSRIGNHLLVNGTSLPTIDVKPGKPIRLRIINPANGRTMRLSAPNQLMFQIGSDGGLMDQVEWIQDVEQIVNGHGHLVSNPDLSQGLIVSPSERVDVVLIPFGKPGEDAFIEWHDMPTGKHDAFIKEDGTVGFGHAHNDGALPPESLVRLHFKRGFGIGWWPKLPLRRHAIEPIELTGDEEPLSIFFGHAPPMPNGNVMFFSAVGMPDALQNMLDMKLAEAENPAHAGPVPGAVMPPMFMPRPFPVLTPEQALHATVGETRVWEVTNFTGGDHTFHTHGFFYQPLEMIEVNLDAETASERVVRTDMTLVQKDSIRVPPRPGAGGRSWTVMRLAVRFDDSDKPPYLRRTDEDLVAFGKVPTTLDPLDPSEGTSGGWLAHCHLLEHADRGMTTFLNLVLP